jgi:glycerophosphoryl diester phosphodiesterase
MACNSVEIQGHRGCRGLVPENTIPSFEKAIDLGVDVLELDVVVSRDKKVVVSHEAFFNHEVCASINGVKIDTSNEKSFNLYKMNYDEIKAINVGDAVNPRFPDQKKMNVYKPLLSEVLEKCDAYSKLKNLSLPKYNIEIKRDKALDGIYNPRANEFVDLVYEVIQKHDLKGRFNIQSFDHEVLNLYHKKDLSTPIAVLVGDQNGIESHLSKLSFKPDIYSPYFMLVDAELVSKCQSRGIKIIPWTVNEVDDALKLIDLGVDAIITDYPDKINKELKK